MFSIGRKENKTDEQTLPLSTWQKLPVTIEMIVADVYKALDAGAYLSALSLTLVLPDMCGEIAYPEIQGTGSTGRKYKDWYNKYVRDCQAPPNQEAKKEVTIVPNGEAIYALRNKMLHGVSADVSNKKLNKRQTIKVPRSGKLKEIVINNLILDINPGPSGLCPIEASVMDFIGFDGNEKSQSGEVRIECQVNVRMFCERVCEAAKKFCLENGCESTNCYLVNSEAPLHEFDFTGLFKPETKNN